MYNGDGLLGESSSCKYVGIDIGGSGIDCGIGETGSSSASDGLVVPFGKGLTADALRSNGSG